MTALCLSTSAALGTYPVLVTAVALLTVCLVWALHLRSLRRCERDLLGLVDQRTRQWQSEVHAHARLRQQVTALSVMADRLLVEAVESAGAWSQNDGPDRPAGDTDGGDGTDVPGRPPQSSIRVLVVEERVDWRGTLEALFDRLGVASSFADSAWAGAVAAGEARGQGTPYHLVLVGPGVERVTDDAVALPDSLDQGQFARLLSGEGQAPGHEGRP